MQARYFAITYRAETTSPATPALGRHFLSLLSLIIAATRPADTLEFLSTYYGP